MKVSFKNKNYSIENITRQGFKKLVFLVGGEWRCSAFMSFLLPNNSL